MKKSEHKQECFHLGDRLQRLRSQYGWSQQDLADQVYVSRQTISNWETGKSYPDLQSLILISKIFQISLDDLAKGDIEIMRETIKRSDIHSMYVYTSCMIALFVVAIFFLGFAIYSLGWKGYILAAICYFLSLAMAFQVEKIKKQYDVQTYREIAAFMDGKRLNEIEMISESGKRSYQNIFKVIAGAIIGILIIALFQWMFQ
ncbi:helix-turn-helix transcriptional regulator [Dubosiella newyorkensis]|uniref:helix-turn-helix transcriptional regulator n=1 Tax=Dubosiella newyorkensis TaxID=1862672 RepID=UPI00272D1E64|nr:helix-turn-helix transcriptional regulator [Dubosiella newyorkensis]